MQTDVQLKYLAPKEENRKMQHFVSIPTGRMTSFWHVLSSDEKRLVQRSGDLSPIKTVGRWCLCRFLPVSG